MKHHYILFILLLVTACNSRQQKNATLNANKSYEPKYAKSFALHSKTDTTILTVINPWQHASDIEFNYILTPNASPDALNEIKIPVERAICMSTTHIAFLSALGKISAISGISGLKHVSDTAVIRMGQEKKISEVGYETNLSYELVFSLKPDVVFAYGVQGEFTNVEKKLNELGIKVVYIGEYLEDTPLGKAEWIVAMSAFFNNQSYAEKIFEKIVTEYNNTKALTTNVENKPKVMLNVPYKDTWYLPGTQSNTVQLINDAGGDYIFSSHNKRESYPMSIEKAFVMAQGAEYWLIGNYAKTLDELKSIDVRMADIPTFKDKKIYNSNLRLNSAGGDDYWESGVIKPEVILKDMIKIMHPELLPNHELYFYRHLE